MSLLARLGLGLVNPRAALAIAGNRKHAGRSGSDLLLAILVVILVTQARRLTNAIWLGVVLGPSYALRGVVQILTDSLAVNLGFLVLSALVIWAAGGPRRDLGRSSDLACVAVLPLLIVELTMSIVVLGLGLELPRAALAISWLVAYVWTGILVGFAVIEARRTSGRGTETEAPRGGKAGWALVGLVAAGIVVQSVWLVRYLDDMRPVMPGDPAPTFKLPRIAAKGAQGEPFDLSSTRGKIVVVDFWATWCNPCTKALPKLEAFQRSHPDVVVVTINIEDDPAEARALFDEEGYSLVLLAWGDAVKTRYNVGPIPHTVVIDRAGVVRNVVRGGKLDLEREISAL